MQKILIIGADGQLGTDLCKVIPKNEQVPLTIADIDITNKAQVRSVIERNAPDMVINTAACNNVDGSEDDEAPAFAVNTYGVKYLAEACREFGSALVHISTDYVFDGEKGKPYVETDVPNPQSIYAISKYAGEQCVKYILDRYFIIRTTGLYGAAGCMGKGGTNFVEGMIKRSMTQSELEVVTDEVSSPTYTLDLARQIEQLIRTRHYGTYHVTNAGSCSWYDFTAEIFKLLGRKVKLVATTAAEFKAKAKRPKYSVLESAQLKKLKLKALRPWQDALKAYLVEKGYLKK